MKNTPHANLTLNPVRRVAAFFALLAFLTLSACESEEKAAAKILDDQTAVFAEMTAVLDGVAKGADPSTAAEQLTQLGEDLKTLKIQFASLRSVDPDKDEAHPALDENFIAAAAAFQKAQQTLFMSGKLTPEINRALTAHLNPAPMLGEGLSE